MVFNIGIPKGLIQVLTKRGKYHKGLKLAEMRAEISSCLLYFICLSVFIYPSNFLPIQLSTTTKEEERSS